MRKNDYLDVLNKYFAEASQYVRDLNEENELNYCYYFREKLGNERPGESQAVSSDCFDVVESDLPSLVRTFLGGGDIIKFNPTNKTDPADVNEAKQKTRLINDLILNQNKSFETLFAWLKGAEISNYSVLTYYPEEEQKKEIIVKEGLSQIEKAQFELSLEEDANVIEYEIEEQEFDQTFDLEVKVTRNTIKYCIEWVPEESFLMTKDGETMRGHLSQETKGDLISKFPDKKDVIKKLTPSFHMKQNNISNTKERQISLGDDEINVTPAWYSEEVIVKTLNVRIDGDNDGYAERRRIIMVDNEILEDEPFDNLNYALLSSYPIPGKPVGKSRVAVTRETQLQKTFMHRGIFNNMALVNKPATAVNTNRDGQVNIDNLLNRRTNSIIQVKGQPQANILELKTTYVGSQALEIINYLDFQRAQSTGATMASQGINRDSIYNETATRFEGVQQEGAAKLEMIMRIYAETGFKHLFQGFEWMVRNYQSSETETLIIGEEIAYNPSTWKYSHQCKPRVGLSSDDTEQMVANIGAILALQERLKQGGSFLVDDSKIYNTITNMLHAMNVFDVGNYFNDPEKPQETLQAELEQAKVLIAQLQEQAQRNPLAEAEQINAQANLIEAQAKDQTERDKSRADILKFNQKLEQEDRHFRAKIAQQERKQRSDFAVDVTKLENESGKDFEGGLDGE